MTQGYGAAGRLASAFVGSKLTPILIIVAILLGVAALQSTPREEEPQIVVPMVDILIGWPGHPADEVERLLTEPVEDVLMDIAALEYLYSTSDEDGTMFIARFDVGYDVEDALVQVNQALAEVTPRLPAGSMEPAVASRSIDDVPVFAVTLSSTTERDNPGQDLTDMAEEIAHDLRQEPNVSDVVIIGGQQREWLINLQPDAMTRYQVSAGQLAQQLRAALGEVPLGRVRSGRASDDPMTGLRLDQQVATPEALRTFPLASVNGQTVYLGDVAEIRPQTAPPRSAVWHSSRDQPAPTEAVTISVSKRAGTNASNLTERLGERLSHLRDAGLIPDDIQLTRVRDYGKTAKEKSDELIKHLLIATLSVVALIAFALGFREALVVAIAVPVTLSLTVLMSFLLGFTINRVTLFALIFSIGILVDDAIVVVENIHRHAMMKDERGWITRILDAVNEVGNPTILATFTVVAAILPMAYVGGLMGPYMLPIPILASLAMMFSLMIAFAVSPWAAVLLMKPEKEGAPQHGEDRLTKIYRKLMGTLLGNRLAYWGFIAFTVLLFLLSLSLVGLRWVEVKMLPFDNKSEVQVVIDMPEGTQLAETARVAFAVTQAIYENKEVEHSQIYVGASSPYTFNGLVRHYFLRQSEHEGDIAIALRDRHDRHVSSHQIAKQLRILISSLDTLGEANVKVVEIPPGPPVLSTLVAEIYGPDLQQQRELAQRTQALMIAMDGVVDVDSYEAADRDNLNIVPQSASMRLHGADASAIATELATLNHTAIALAPDQPGRQGVPIRIGMDEPVAKDARTWKRLPIPTPNGMTPLAALAQFELSPRVKPIYHKNNQRVIYVIAEVAGAIEAPIYALGDLQSQIQAEAKNIGIDQLPIFHTSMPLNAERPSLKWDGEWHITVEVFRDMGIAFAAVIILIYLLVVGWFRSFTIPLVILSPIPLSLVGILPGHLMFGAFFTATSMIGFIAGAGIIVRNSIILVDFIELKRNQGSTLNDAVIEAGVIRFRPMLLTASAVVIGSAVILFDPIFQGLAISLMMGEVAATLLSRIAVPLLYAGVNRVLHLKPHPHAVA